MCLAYDSFRILRQLIPHSLKMVNIEDAIYWIMMTAVLFYLLFTYNRGEIRSFTIAGILTGSVFYLNTISHVYISLISWLLRPIFHIISKIQHFIVKRKGKPGNNY